MDPITLQNLLDELAREGGNLTEYLSTAVTEGRLTVEAADALLAEAATMAETIVNAEERSAADVTTLQGLAEAVDGVRETRTALIEAAEAEQTQIAELAARIAPPTDSETPAEDAPAEGDETDAPADGDDADPDNSDSGLTPDDIVNAPVVDTTQDPEVVVASSEPPARPRLPRINLSDVSRRTQRPNPIDLPGNGQGVPFGGSLVAASDAPGKRAGTAYDSWLELGHAGARAFGSMKPRDLQSLVAAAERSGGPSFQQKTGLAEFRLNFPDELVANGHDDTEVFALAADQSRLEGGSLTAGWCSPSETMYDLCELPCSLDGILSTPEVLAPRGGVRWTKGLDFEAIYSGTGYFHFTEAQMDADPRPEKPCMEIPCVDFDECRLDVDGLCITGDIMQSRTYPEVVAQFMQGAMCAHAHRVNAFKLAAIAAGSTNDGTITQAGYGATASVLYAIELEIQAYRYRGRRAQEGSPALLELVAPYWIKAVLRADIANRNAPSGIGNPLAVTDAEIVQWFASRGVAVQFVYDWQDLVGVVEEPGAPVTDYPNTVEFILYEAGTWIVPMLDVITLESIYDSTLIKQNKFTALFTEQAFCVINRCNGSRRFTVPVCANGNTGAQVAVTCA